MQKLKIGVKNCLVKNNKDKTVKKLLVYLDLI